MVTVEQLTEVIQAGKGRFLFGHPQKLAMIEYLRPDEVPTTFCNVKEISIPALTARRNQGLYVLLTSQRFIAIALDKHAGTKGWAALDFNSIELSEFTACSDLTTNAISFDLTGGGYGRMVGWKKTMQRMHDALATAIGQDPSAPSALPFEFRPQKSGAPSGSGAAPTDSPGDARSDPGRFRIAFQFCFMTIPGIIGVIVTVLAVVLLPGPSKMVPVVLFGGVIGQRVSSGASG